MFHCFNISRHISISVLFFINFVSCLWIFCCIFENNSPRCWVLARFFCPRGRTFAPFVPGGWGIRPFKKFPGNRPYSGEPLLVGFYTSLNADISGTRKDIKKRSTVFFPVFPVLSCISYPLISVQVSFFEDLQNIFSQSKSHTPNYQANPLYFKL